MVGSERGYFRDDRNSSLRPSCRGEKKPRTAIVRACALRSEHEQQRRLPQHEGAGQGHQNTQEAVVAPLLDQQLLH